MKKINILVVGDECTDIFQYGDCTRICPEAPVPVFNPIETKENRGMAGNVLNNLLALGAEATIISGGDKSIKKRFVDVKSNQMLLRVDYSDCAQEKFKIDGIDFSKFDCILISDYDKGFLSKKDIQDIAVSHPFCFLDTKKRIGEWASGIRFIKINEAEYLDFMSHEPANRFSEKLIVTLSERGATYNGVLYPAKGNLEVKDVAGAGDTFFAALAVKYMETKDIGSAIEAANECAGIVISKKGVSTI